MKIVVGKWNIGLMLPLAACELVRTVEEQTVKDGNSYFGQHSRNTMSMITFTHNEGVSSSAWK